MFTNAVRLFLTNNAKRLNAGGLLQKRVLLSTVLSSTLAEVIPDGGDDARPQNHLEVGIQEQIEVGVLEVLVQSDFRLEVNHNQQSHLKEVVVKPLHVRGEVAAGEEVHELRDGSLVVVAVDLLVDSDDDALHILAGSVLHVDHQHVSVLNDVGSCPVEQGSVHLELVLLGELLVVESSDLSPYSCAVTLPQTGNPHTHIHKEDG